MKIASIIATLLISFAAVGQSTDQLNRKVEPKGGIAAVALVYYKIDFNQEEVDYLRTHEAELIFMVDEEGKARLEKVNNIEMRSIVDAMMMQDDVLPDFLPQLADGKPESAIYFMKVRWPQYEMAVMPSEYTNALGPWGYVGRKLDEFESITYQGARFDMLIGGVGNMLGGDASQYNKGGGGMKMDMMFYGKSGWGGGLVMTFHGNNLKKEYPMNTALPQSTSRMILFVGIAVGKLLKEMPRGQLILQFEPCYASQTIVTADPQLKNKPVQTQGFSPGILINYALMLGKGRMSHYYLLPTAWRSYLNFHVGVRPLLLDVPQASGYMIEGGLAYRMALKQVVDFKLK